MQITNTKNRYGIVAILLHWLMALFIFSMLGVGLYMVSLPMSADKIQLYGMHKASGFMVLSLAVCRLLWRLNNVTPQLLLPKLEKLAATSVHWLLYGLIFAMPLSGWLMTSAAGLPVSFFGLFVIPTLIAPNTTALEIFRFAHMSLAFTLIGLIAVHTLAALKHHFYDNDDILRRILP